MKLYLNSKETAINVKKAEGLFQRAAGLIPLKKMKDNECLVFDRCNSIHTFFMRFPIDVVFCSADGVVTSAARVVKPWRFAFDFKASFTVELQSGLAEGLGIREGCIIKFN